MFMLLFRLLYKFKQTLSILSISIFFFSIVLENRGDATARQESQSQLFHDFLLRANRYGQLNVSNESPSRDKKNKVILVEVRTHSLFTVNLCLLQLRTMLFLLFVVMLKFSYYQRTFLGQTFLNVNVCSL